MKAALFPLRSNRLLDRPLILSFNLRFRFSSPSLKTQFSCFNEACLTPELTGRETTASCDKLTMGGTLNPVGCNRLLDRPRDSNIRRLPYFAEMRHASLGSLLTRSVSNAGDNRRAIHLEGKRPANLRVRFIPLLDSVAL